MLAIRKNRKVRQIQKQKSTQILLFRGWFDDSIRGEDKKAVCSRGTQSCVGPPRMNQPLELLVDSRLERRWVSLA